MDIEAFQKLIKGEKGERANLKAGYNWIISKMSYSDFCKFARLDFLDERRGHSFSYEYMIAEEHDTKKTREEYLKYLVYKLVQNIMTENIKLQ